MSTVTRRQSMPLNVLTAVSGFGVLVGCLALVDTRIRDQIAQIITGHAATTEVGGAVMTIHNTASSYFGFVRDQAAIYAPLTIFGIAALVFVVLMTRTRF